MPNITGIHWTDRTSNPIKAKVAGKNGWFCIKVSEGCKNCYSERLNKRLGNKLSFDLPSLDKVDWWLNQKELTGLRKLKPGLRVFLFSMTDPFADFFPKPMLFEVWKTINDLPHITFQILTKRPENFPIWENYLIALNVPAHQIWPDNLWIGTSIENKRHLDRIPILVNDSNAPVTFLSFEPLLEDLGQIDLSFIDWVIVGGESGRGHRDFDPQWALNIQKQCVEQDVAFFFKQSAADKPGQERKLAGQIWEAFPE